MFDGARVRSVVLYLQGNTDSGVIYMYLLLYSCHFVFIFKVKLVSSNFTLKEGVLSQNDYKC